MLHQRASLTRYYENGGPRVVQYLGSGLGELRPTARSSPAPHSSHNQQVPRFLYPASRLPAGPQGPIRPLPHSLDPGACISLSRLPALVQLSTATRVKTELPGPLQTLPLAASSVTAWPLACVPCPYLFQRVHLGGHLVDVGMHFHQVHAVQGALQEIHHGLQLPREG